jgi:hypothetical protein
VASWHCLAGLLPPPPHTLRELRQRHHGTVTRSHQSMPPGQEPALRLWAPHFSRQPAATLCSGIHKTHTQCVAMTGCHQPCERYTWSTKPQLRCAESKRRRPLWSEHDTERPCFSLSVQTWQASPTHEHGKQTIAITTQTTLTQAGHGTSASQSSMHGQQCIHKHCKRPAPQTQATWVM